MMWNLIASGTTTASAILFTFVVVKLKGLEKSLDELKLEFKKHIEKN